jgi:creatinine amidohydrolase
MMSILQDIKWRQAEEEIKQTRTVLIPVGATEQHGHHMPLGSDSYCAFEVAKRTVARESAVVAPVIPYGISHCHMSFAGTITLTCETMARMIREICESLYRHGIDKFIFINGHGHNGPTIAAAIDEFKKDKKVYMFVIPWWIAGGKLTNDLWDFSEGNLPDGHGADIEASGMLAINEELVDMLQADRVILGEMPNTCLKFHKSTAVTLKDYPVELTTISDFNQFTDSGLIGGALNASKEKGERVLDAVADFLAELIRELKKL